MIHRAGSARVQSRFEKQTKENMDLKMYLKSRKMAENKCRKARMGEKQWRAFRAQCLWTCVPADSSSSSNKSNKARAVLKLQREKDELIAISDS